MHVVCMYFSSFIHKSKTDRDRRVRRTTELRAQFAGPVWQVYFYYYYYKLVHTRSDTDKPR